MRLLINIDVPDLETALTFYQAALGLVHSRTIDGDVAELIGASCVLYLLRKPPGSTVSSAATATRQYTRHWTPVHIDFVVEGIEEAAKRALLAGAKQESECIEWMGSKCITFSDPFGHGFCLIEFRGKTYSEVPPDSHQTATVAQARASTGLT
jgi:predicted enzyme related to lactoylglutathione lyase